MNQMIRESKHQRRMDAHRHLEQYREGYLAAMARIEKEMRGTVLTALGQHRLQQMFEMEDDGPGAAFPLVNLLALDPADEATQQQELEALTDTVCDALNKLLPRDLDEPVKPEPLLIAGLRQIATMKGGRETVADAAQLAKAALEGIGVPAVSDSVPASAEDGRYQAATIADVLMHMSANDLIRWNGSGNDEDDAWSDREELAATLGAVQNAMESRMAHRRAEARGFNPIEVLTKCAVGIAGENALRVLEVVDYLKARRDGIVDTRLYWGKVTTSRLSPWSFAEAGDKVFYLADQVEYLVSDGATHAANSYDRGLRVGRGQFLASSEGSV